MKAKIISLLVLVMSYHSYSQNGNEVIATIGNKTITAEEFKYRYEFTPQINRKYFDQGKAKEELLYTLIAENLFAAEAENLGLDTVEAMKRNFLPLEKMYVRDALYKELISDKVKMNNEKFNEGLVRANSKLFVDFVYSKEKNNVEKAYEILRNGPNFDSLVTLLKNAEYVKEPYEVNYGKMYYQAEDAIYNLEMNEFTEPIESPEGWYIFRLIGKVPVTINSNDQRNSLVKKVVEGRVEDSIYSEFWTKFFTDRKITTDGSLFWYFAEEMRKLITSIKSEQNIKDGEKIVVSNEMFASLKNNIPIDSLKKDFIRFKERPISFDSFYNDFAFEGFYTFSTDPDQIAAQLNSRVKRQIELELLAREAYDKGMENLPDVRSATDIWKENYLSVLFKKRIVMNTEISDDEILKYLKDEQNSLITEDQVNILEILTDSLEVIKEALNLVSDDNAFREFVKSHTKREWSKESNGEFGYFPVSEYGEIGKIASSMEIGDVYGPLETDEGYSLFKLIGKKTDSLKVDINNISTEIKTNIRYEKIKNDLEDLTAELAEKYGVTVNNSLLNSLNLLNSQMVVFRYMGFGGRMQAFPYSSPFFQWKEKWEQKKKDLL